MTWFYIFSTGKLEPKQLASLWNPLWSFAVLRSGSAQVAKQAQEKISESTSHCEAVVPYSEMD